MVGSAPQVDDRPPAAEHRLDLDRDVPFLRVDQPRPEDVRDGDRVVDGGSIPAVRLAVVAGEEDVEVGDERSDVSYGAELLFNGRPEQRLMRDVEPDHGEVEISREDDGSRLRVAPDVELRRRRE